MKLLLCHGGLVLSKTTAIFCPSLYFDDTFKDTGHINCAMSGDSHLHCVDDDDDDGGGSGGKVCECRRGYVISGGGGCVEGKPGHIKVTLGGRGVDCEKFISGQKQEILQHFMTYFQRETHTPTCTVQIGLR